MSHTPSTLSLPLSARAVALAFVISSLPLGAAFAQLPEVRIGSAEVEVRANAKGKGDTMMVAAPGTTLQYIDVDGDYHAHREGNWYYVLLPRDAWGTQRVGWVSGRDVELVPAAPRPAASAMEPSFSMMSSDRTEQPSAAAPVPVVAEVRRPTPPPPTVQPVAIPEVIVNFEFNRSELTADAKAKLAEPAAQLKGGAQALAVAVEGHADWVGSDGYNEKLGMARAENVRRYLSETLQIPADRMTVVSYGEGQPVAPNSTSEGRAQNRRVVVKVKP